MMMVLMMMMMVMMMMRPGILAYRKAVTELGVAFK
jgi:hypothetical protein